MEQRRQWNFESTDSGWVWRVTQPNGTKESSAKAFETLKECAADATRHGYVAWKAEDERRRDQRLGVSAVLNRDTIGK